MESSETPVLYNVTMVLRSRVLGTQRPKKANEKSLHLQVVREIVDVCGVRERASQIDGEVKIKESFASTRLVSAILRMEPFRCEEETE